MKDINGLSESNHGNGSENLEESSTFPPASASDKVTKSVSNSSDLYRGSDAGDSDATIVSGTQTLSSETSQPQTETPNSVTLKFGDQDITFEEDHIRQLVALQQWASSLPEETRQAYAAIESGQGVVLPVDEAREFLIWKQQGKISKPAPKLPDFVEPEVTAAFEQVQSELADLRNQMAQQSVAQQLPNPDSRFAQSAPSVQQIEAEVVTAIEQFKINSQLTDQQIEPLLASAGQLRLIPTLLEQGTVRAPNGAVISAPSYAAATTQALQMIAAMNGIQVQSQPPSAQQSVVNQHTSNVVPIKKARASSLAAMPSSSASVPAKSPRDMTPQELSSAISKHLINLGDAAEN
jgi:hypothetical protein